MKSTKTGYVKQLLLTALITSFGILLTPVALAATISDYQGQNYQDYQNHQGDGDHEGHGGHGGHGGH